MITPSDQTQGPVLPGRVHRISTRLVFFSGGFVSAAWTPLIPFAKSRLHLDDGALGLLILFFGLGSLFAMPLAGWVAGKKGCRSVLRVTMVAAAILLPLLAITTSIPSLAINLFLFGAAVGALDVVINVQAVLVEKAHGRPLMSGFHAGWSIGGFLAAGSMTAFLAVGVAPVIATIVVSSIVVALALVSDRGLLSEGSPASQKRPFTLPHGLVLVIALLCFVAFLAEGSVADWGAVFLSSNKGTPLEFAGLGFASFSAVMLVCRLAGDRIVRSLGGFRVLLFGGATAAAGFVVVVLSQPLWLSLVGFGLVGLGMSNIVPVLFSLTGRQNKMPANQAVSVVGSIAYAGILAGPAMIGGVAHFAGLSTGLIIVAALVAVIGASAFIARE